MKMKKCSECRSGMKELVGKTPEGFEYKYFKCEKCGEEILNMTQLHDVALKYRQMKKVQAKVSKWGTSLGIRIPKEFVKKYKLKDNEEVTIVPEESGMRIIPA